MTRILKDAPVVRTGAAAAAATAKTGGERSTTGSTKSAKPVTEHPDTTGTKTGKSQASDGAGSVGPGSGPITENGGKGGNHPTPTVGGTGAKPSDSKAGKDGSRPADAGTDGPTVTRHHDDDLAGKRADDVIQPVKLPTKTGSGGDVTAPTTTGGDDDVSLTPGATVGSNVHHNFGGEVRPQLTAPDAPFQTHHQYGGDAPIPADPALPVGQHEIATQGATVLPGVAEITDFIHHLLGDDTPTHGGTATDTVPASTTPGPLVVTSTADIPNDGEDHIVDDTPGDDPSSQSGNTGNYVPGTAHDGGIHHNYGG